MKTVGIVILFAIFLIGSYEFGLHQPTISLVHRADSLQLCLKQIKSNDSFLYRQIDTMRQQLAMCKMRTSKKSLVKKLPDVRSF